MVSKTDNAVIKLGGGVASDVKEVNRRGENEKREKDFKKKKKKIGGRIGAST